MKVINEFRNELLKRREIRFVFEAESNPGFAHAKKILVEELKVPEENAVVKFIKNNFGTREFNVEAFVYDNEEMKDKIERKPKIKKGAGKS